MITLLYYIIHINILDTLGYNIVTSYRKLINYWSKHEQRYLFGCVYELDISALWVDLKINCRFSGWVLTERAAVLCLRLSLCDNTHRSVIKDESNYINMMLVCVYVCVCVCVCQSVVYFVISVYSELAVSNL